MVTVVDKVLVELGLIVRKNNLKKFNKDLAIIEKTADAVKKGIATPLPGFDDFAKKTHNLGKSIKADMVRPIQEARAEFNNFRNNLLNLGLSVLFFGASIQRLSTSIIKSGISAFNKITTGSNEAGGALGVLQVHFELLKFSIGAAISSLVEAYLPAIVTIITGIADWIQQNDKLIAILTVLGGVGGTIAVVTGSILSFAAGVSVLLGPISKLVTKLGGLSTVLKGLVGATLIIGLIWRMFGRDHVSLPTDVIKDAFIAAAGALFLRFGPAGAILGAAFVIAFETAAILLDLTNMELLTFAWERAVMMAKQAWEQVVFSIKSAIRLLESLKPGGETPMEAYLANINDQIELVKGNLDEIQQFDLRVGKARGENKLKGLKEELSAEQLSLEFKGGDFFKGLSADQQKELTEIASLTGKSIEELVEQMKSTSVAFEQAETFMNTFANAQKEQTKTVMDSTRTLVEKDDMMVKATEKTTTALENMGKAFVDMTGKWLEANTKINDQLNKHFGVTGTSHNSGGIDFGTTVQAEQILRRRFGNQLAGVGQFIPKALSDLNTNRSAGPSVIVDRSRPTVINGQTIINNTPARGLGY